MNKNSPDSKSPGGEHVKGPLIESYSQPGAEFSRYEAWLLGTLNVLLINEAEAAAQEAFDCLTSIEQRLSKFLNQFQL